jgi:pimeloyl-ACP methyl ester carboxylesterase
MSHTFRIMLFAMLTSALTGWNGEGLAQTDEMGNLNGVPYRVQIPSGWNRGLVVYAHGYLDRGREWRPLPDLYSKVFLERGFALIESGYSRQGWAVAEALAETEALRKHFVEVHGKPDTTFVMGFSMGGLIALAAIESHPDIYDGALPMCGPLVPSLAFFTRVFDMLVTFEGVFGMHLPGDLRPVVEVLALPLEAVTRALQADTVAAALFARRWDIREPELPRLIAFFHMMYRECVERAGGNPIDNRNTIYCELGPIDALNAAVPRYAADSKAVDYLRRYYTPTGDIDDPVVAVHTTYDPGVAPELPSRYTVTAALEGNDEHFVQMYVEADGHCNFQPQLIGKAFDALRFWTAGGPRPAPGILQ